MATAPTPKKKSSATVLTLPKKLVAGIQTLDPSTGKSVNSAIPDQSTFYFNTDIASIRGSSNAYDVMRALVKASGDVAMAVASYVRLADTNMKFMVYDDAHQISSEGMTLLRSFIASQNNLNDYTYGFDDRQDTEGISATLLNEVMLTGACALEVVLDKARLPFRLQPVSPANLKWRVSDVDTGNGVTHKIIPWQQSSGKEIILDIPTFFVARLDHDVTTVYPKPPLEVAHNSAVFSAEVMQDIRRAVRRSGHSRLVVTLNTEMLMKAAPIEEKADPAKLTVWLESVRSSLESQVAGLNPESALVVFDAIKADYLNSEIGASADYSPFMDVVDGQTATALRTPPSVLGKRMGGSQNTSSSESLLFLKHVEGIRKPVRTVMSRGLTLVLRLFGFPGYVVASHDPVNLRPEEELEAFKQMKQARVLEQLSLGFLTDQEAAEQLGTGLRAPDAPPLSGTRFYGQTNASMDPTAIANGGDPARRALTGDAPTKAGGSSQ